MTATTRLALLGMICCSTIGSAGSASAQNLLITVMNNGRIYDTELVRAGANTTFDKRINVPYQNGAQREYVRTGLSGTVAVSTPNAAGQFVVTPKLQVDILTGLRKADAGSENMKTTSVEMPIVNTVIFDETNYTMSVSRPITIPSTDANWTMTVTPQK